VVTASHADIAAIILLAIQAVLLINSIVRHLKKRKQGVRSLDSSGSGGGNGRNLGN
jgi:hypothetical protein